MPVVVDPDPHRSRRLLAAMPAGAHGVDSTERLAAWLGQHPEEYVVVLGPNLELDDGAGRQRGPAHRPADHQRRPRPRRRRRRRCSPGRCRPAPATSCADRRPRRCRGGGRPGPPAARRAPGPDGSDAAAARSITVFSPKGGVGKTTVAVNLALALADRGARQVCLVDLDLAFGDVAITLQLFPSHTIEHADRLRGRARRADARHRC